MYEYCIIFAVSFNHKNSKTMEILIALIVLTVQIILVFNIIWIAQSTKKTTRLLAHLLNEMNADRFEFTNHYYEILDVKKKTKLKY